METNTAGNLCDFIHWKSTIFDFVACLCLSGQSVFRCSISVIGNDRAGSWVLPAWCLCACMAVSQTPPFPREGAGATTTSSRDEWGDVSCLCSVAQPPHSTAWHLSPGVLRPGSCQLLQLVGQRVRWCKQVSPAGSSVCVVSCAAQSPKAAGDRDVLLLWGC